jgi:hypothetical protein
LYLRWHIVLSNKTDPQSSILKFILDSLNHLVVRRYLASQSDNTNLLSVDNPESQQLIEDFRFLLA